MASRLIDRADGDIMGDDVLENDGDDGNDDIINAPGNCYHFR